MSVVIQKISIYLRMIKFSHSIFALPFAFTSAIIAASGLHEGYMLVQTSADTESEDMAVYDVFDGDGAFVNEVVMRRVAGFRSGFAYALKSDEESLPMIVRYRLKESVENDRP